jgi:hypothetical protein
VVFERGPVTPNDAAATVIAHFTDNRDAILAQRMLFLLRGAIYLWFISSLRTFLLRAEGGSGRVSTVAFGSGVTWVAINMVAQAFQVGLAMAPAAGAPPALIGTMNTVFTIAALPLAVMLTAVAMNSLRHHAAPTRLGWIAAAAAGSQPVLWLGTIAENGPLAADGWLTYALYAVFVIWLLPATVVMIRQAGQPRIPDTPRQQRTAQRVLAEVVGPSLRWATTRITKTTRTQPGDEAPYDVPDQRAEHTVSEALIILRSRVRVAPAPPAACLWLEAVADAGFGDQVLWSGGVELEFAAELGHVDAQVVGLRLVGGSPDLEE